MKKLWAPIVAALLAVMVVTPVASGASDPFTRTWSRIDVDGSRETLTFDGSADLKTFAYRDERATSCAGDPFESGGSVDVDGDTATFDGTGGCVGGPSAPVSGTFAYDANAATIDDASGVLWHRGNGAREAFLGVWKATDVDGSDMKLTFRGDGLVRDVTFVDELATSCDPDAVWMAQGTGTIGSTVGQGRYITTLLHGGCIGAEQGDFGGEFRYDVETDTLRGPLDLGNELPDTVDWHRG